MTRYSITASIALAILFAGPIVTYAEAVLYTPDKWHTRIYFTVSHMGLSNYGADDRRPDDQGRDPADYV